MAAVEAGLTGVSVSITALGRAVSGCAYLKQKINRVAWMKHSGIQACGTILAIIAHPPKM